MTGKRDWHWKCRWFNHKYVLADWQATYGTSDVCLRCGFDPREAK